MKPNEGSWKYNLRKGLREIIERNGHIVKRAKFPEGYEARK
jgi:hypothetical protein